MERNELMINDLVLYNNRVHKVTTIGLISIGLNGKPVGQTDNIFSNRNYLHPIPLDREVLEQMGFKLIGNYYSLTNGDYLIDYNPNYFTLEITNDKKGMVVFSCDYEREINLHELQHALRMAGLRELADNLKY